VSRWLRRVEPGAVAGLLRAPVDSETISAAAEIVEDVRRRGEAAVRDHSIRFGDIDPEQPLVVTRQEIEDALASLPGSDAQLLERVAGRIRAFARAQRDSVTDIDVEVPGGRAGHRWFPVSTAGAYAPGGRYPLPSTVLMTVTPARVAGVAEIWVSSPRPTAMTLAAAAVAGSDGLLRVGGAQAIAALAFGVAGPRCDVIVGPGNRWVTAAKKVLFGEVGIDGLAGPSEIVVIADGEADPVLVAADLIAQAEHDVDALPILITPETEMLRRVDEEVERQMGNLGTAGVAGPALRKGYAVVVDDLQQAAEVSDRIAPEHLALHVARPDETSGRVSNYGSMFCGSSSAETFADYGAGPNHVLPTGGSARFQSGLSPVTFLKAPTWLALSDAGEVIADTARLARHEALEGHARAAEARVSPLAGEAGSPRRS
jgi:histidinol dehydrogenase